MHELVASPKAPATWPRRLGDALARIEAAPPSKVARSTLWAVCVLVIALIAWSCLGRLDIVATTEGRLVPQTYIKVVQPAEAGVVREILVSEGQLVRAGQVLLRLDATLVTADQRAVQSDAALKRLTIARIDAELAGKASMPIGMASEKETAALLAQVQNQLTARRQAYSDATAQQTAARDKAREDLVAARAALDKLRRTLPSYEHAARSYADLKRQGFASELAAQEKERDAVEKQQDLKSQTAAVHALEATLESEERKLVQVQSQYRSQLHTERTQALADLRKLEQDEAKAGFKQGLLELKAPQDGIVQDVATSTIGAVVQPGTALLSLVPQGEPLVAEVSVRNEDIGFVQPGQRVQVKLAAFPFQKYGTAEGVVRVVLPDAANNGNNASERRSPGGTDIEMSRYKALVELDHQQLVARGETLKLRSGMQVQADVVLGTRTVAEYLLSPIQGTVASAGRER